jgi:hypothetical protein
VLYDPKCARLKADPRFSDLLKSLHFARPDQHETWRDRAAFGDRTY